jgi:hypothetical protein
MFALMQQLQPKKESSELKERITDPPRTLFPRIRFKDADRIMRATAKAGVEFIFKPLEDTSEEFDPEEVKPPPAGAPSTRKQIPAASPAAMQEGGAPGHDEGKKSTVIVAIGFLLAMVAGIYHLYKSGALEPVIALIKGL